MKKRTQDSIALVALAVFAVLVSLFAHATFLSSAVLFFGLPCIYLLVRGRTKWKETLAAVTVFGFLYSFLLDYMAEYNGAWAWRPSQLIIQQKIFGVVTPEALIWTMLWVLLLVLFYEHMLDRDRVDRVSPRLLVATAIGFSLLGAIVWFRAFEPARLTVTHAYFYFGLCSLPPLALALYKNPRLTPKLLWAAAYFVPLYLSYELVGRYLGQWDFPGHYFGMIEVLGITFPIEEFMFWILGSSVITLAGYELLIDDLK